jgi:hypothetical protein
MDEFLAVYQAGQEALAAWVEQLVDIYQQPVATLTVRLEQLEARLNKDSHNGNESQHSLLQNVTIRSSHQWIDYSID